MEDGQERMRSTALADGLLRDDVLRSVRYCEGYTDLLGPTTPVRRGLAQRAMRSPVVAAVYERVWRPIMVAIMRMHGISVSAEHEMASSALQIGGDQRVLDVGCGPGNFTAFFAEQLGGGGFVIGLDSSEPMMQRAVRDNSAERAVYLRADARSLPFNDCVFDVVSCFAALHLVPEPIEVLHEMVRVLSPGGRIAVMTTYGRESVLLRKILERGAASCGVRVFDRTAITAFFAAVGLTDIEQQLRGFSQFVTARRPDQINEVDGWRSQPPGWGTEGTALGH